MDWLRRNWPDLLIGVALVAVIAGIIATLISGGSFFPFGQGGGGTTTTPQPSTPITSPTTQPSAAQPGTTMGEAGVTTPTTPTTSGSEQTGSSEQAGTEGAEAPTSSPSSEGIAVLPPSGSGATPAATPSATPATQPSATGSSEGATGTASGVTALPPAGATPSTPSTSAPATDTQPSTAPSATTPSTATPVAASADADEASYRVSVGAFGNADNAQRLAQQFQGAGYPVLLGTQGNLTIVLLGPYATDAEARRVAGQVDGSFGVVDPTVYRYEPDDAVASAPAATPAAPATATPAAPAPAASTTAPAAPAAPTASATGRYLQVGAYANRESSLPQRERLEGIGFTVTEVQEGELLKLLVGPYQGAALSDAQSRLAAEGIENFARGL